MQTCRLKSNYLYPNSLLQIDAYHYFQLLLIKLPWSCISRDLAPFWKILFSPFKILKIYKYNKYLTYRVFGVSILVRGAVWRLVLVIVDDLLHLANQLRAVVDDFAHSILNFALLRRGCDVDGTLALSHTHLGWLFFVHLALARSDSDDCNKSTPNIRVNRGTIPSMPIKKSGAHRPDASTRPLGHPCARLLARKKTLSTQKPQALVRDLRFICMQSLASFPQYLSSLVNNTWLPFNAFEILVSQRGNFKIAPGTFWPFACTFKCSPLS